MKLGSVEIKTPEEFSSPRTIFFQTRFSLIGERLRCVTQPNVIVNPGNFSSFGFFNITEIR